MAWLLDTLISHLLIGSATTQSEIQTLNAAGEKYWMGISFTISMINLITNQHLCVHTLYSSCTTLSANHCFVWLETLRQSIWFAKFWPHPDWVHFLVFWSGNLIFVGNLCPDTRFRWVVRMPHWHSDQWGKGLVITKAKTRILRYRYWKTSLLVPTMDFTDFPCDPHKASEVQDGDAMAKVHRLDTLILKPVDRPAIVSWSATWGITFVRPPPIMPNDATDAT